MIGLPPILRSRAYIHCCVTLNTDTSILRSQKLYKHTQRDYMKQHCVHLKINFCDWSYSSHELLCVPHTHILSLNIQYKNISDK